MEEHAYSPEPGSGPPIDDLRYFGRRLVGNLAKNWWVLLVRGLAAIAFGVMAWFWPGISITTLVILFGVFALADGVLGVLGAFTGPKPDHRWVLVLWGLVGIGVGLLTVFAPGVTAVTLLFFIASWAIATGVLEIVAAIRLRREIEGEWILILGGLASVAFGLILALRPGAGALALIWIIGTYAVFFGILMALLAFRVRSVGKRLRETPA